MNNDYFFAQDQAGGVQRVHVVRHAATQESEGSNGKRAIAYALDDGRPLRRIDTDTFQVLDTGAVVTLVRD